MTEREITFESAGLQISGTLALPDGPCRDGCVLMLAGSGQVDRDENHKKMRINVLGELAQHLAGRGVASLRYDKRGVGRSEGDFWATGLYDNVADAKAALVFLRAEGWPGGERLFLLGHSEGAYIATRVAADAPDLAGVVLLAGGARSGEEELLWQGAQVASSLTGFNGWLVKVLRIDVTKSQRKQIEKIKRSRTDRYRAQLVAKINAKWMRELLAYDPREDLARISCPILAITGSKDIQVAPENLSVMESIVTAPFERHVVPDVTHLLRSDPGPPGLSSYKAQAKRPVDPRVVATVLEWVERETGPVPC